MKLITLELKLSTGYVERQISHLLDISVVKVVDEHVYEPIDELLRHDIKQWIYALCEDICIP